MINNKIIKIFIKNDFDYQIKISRKLRLSVVIKIVFKLIVIRNTFSQSHRKNLNN